MPAKKHSSARRRLAVKSPVTWVNRSTGKAAPFAKQHPRYIEQLDVPDEIANHLKPGNLFVAVTDLNVDNSWVASEIPLLTYGYAGASCIPKGSLLMYSGMIRHDEQRSISGNVVSVKRHTFIANTGRYIIVKFSLIETIEAFANRNR